MKHPEQAIRVSRRDILSAAGTTFVAATLLKSPFEFSVLAQAPDKVMTKNGGMKPTVLPNEGSQNPWLG